jgi:hypothetical protein
MGNSDQDTRSVEMDVANDNCVDGEDELVDDDDVERCLLNATEDRHNIERTKTSIIMQRVSVTSDNLNIYYNPLQSITIH